MKDNKIREGIMSAWVVTLVLTMLSCGCKSDRFELKSFEHLRLNGSVACDIQDVAIIVETADEYNRRALCGLLSSELARISNGRINCVTNQCANLGDSFVKVVFSPDYSGGPGVNAGLSFGLAGALVGEAMRDGRDYVARYSGTIESKLKERLLTRKEFDVRAIFQYEAGTVEDDKMVKEGQDKFRQMTFSQRYLLNKGKAEGETIAPIIEAYLRKKYYPLLAEHLAASLFK